MKKIFFSYSHADEPIRDKLDKQFSILVRQQRIETWYDRNIDVGSNIDARIEAALLDSDIILLLVSHDFISSKYCYEKEMEIAMTRHNAKKAVVVPVIARPCDWHDAPFGRLMASPTDGVPISKWEDEDSALLDVVRSLKRIL